MLFVNVRVDIGVVDTDGRSSRWRQALQTEVLIVSILLFEIIQDYLVLEILFA